MYRSSGKSNKEIAQEEGKGQYEIYRKYRKYGKDESEILSKFQCEELFQYGDPQVKQDCIKGVEKARQNEWRREKRNR